MTSKQIIDAGKLIGAGLAAGLVGSLAMSFAQRAEMRLTGRAASKMPAKAVEILANVAPRNERQEQKLSTAGHLVFGTSMGLGLAAFARMPGVARGLSLFAGAWGVGTGVIMALGLSDPPTRWSGKELATDLAHHAVYAASATAAFAGLRRLAGASA